MVLSICAMNCALGSKGVLDADAACWAAFAASAPAASAVVVLVNIRMLSGLIYGLVDCLVAGIHQIHCLAPNLILELQDGQPRRPVRGLSIGCFGDCLVHVLPKHVL